MQKLILVILFSISIASCGNYPCGKAFLSIALISFTDQESDTLILRRFSKGTNFSSLSDSVLITKSNSNFERRSDTLLILHYGSTGYPDITSDYDYHVFIRKANRLYKITEIAEQVQYGRRYGLKIYCINPITSIKVDGAATIPNYNFIYLKK